MNEQLISMVSFLATATGSGLAAQWAFGKAREAFPVPSTAPASAFAAFLYRCLYAPRYARYSVLTLAVVVGSLSSGILAAATGADFNTMAAAMLAPVVSQIEHARKHLSNQVD